MCGDGEEDEEQWEAVDEVEEDVETDDCLREKGSACSLDTARRLTYIARMPIVFAVFECSSISSASHSSPLAVGRLRSAALRECDAATHRGRG